MSMTYDVEQNKEPDYEKAQRRLTKILSRILTEELSREGADGFLDGFKQGREAGDILPRPVKRDGKGIPTDEYTTREWYEKIIEEVMEAHREAVKLEVDCDYDDFPESIAKEHSNEAEELMDIITVCTGRLAAIGYDTAKKWHELAIKVNKKNGERGYFDD